MNNIPRFALTPGEPAGIGPDLLIQLAQQKSPLNAELIIVADPEMMMQRAETLGLPLILTKYDKGHLPSNNAQSELKIIAISCAEKVTPGQLNKNNARYVLDTLTRATQGCIDKEFDAIVTAPLHKGIINDAGIPFTGHTEFLAELTKAPLPVMMLAADSRSSTTLNTDLRVSLATTHLPLKDVSNAITKQSLRQVINVLHHDLREKFGIDQPHILVCGLNPHAGEDGHMGMEEIDTITPVINEFKQAGMNLSGPLPADTLFTPKYLNTADAVLAMYHDQGLPVLKHVGFGHGINITLGLPIIRTSVDHGTALDLAGSGKAQTGSLIAAIEAAINMTNANNN